MIARALLAATLLFVAPAPRLAASAPNVAALKAAAPAAKHPAPRVAPVPPRAHPPKAAPPAPRPPAPKPPVAKPPAPKPPPAKPPAQVAPPAPITSAPPAPVSSESPTPPSEAPPEPLPSATPTIAAEPPPVPTPPAPSASSGPEAPKAAPPVAPRTEAAPASLVIDIHPSGSGSAWFAAGLEAVAGNEFRRFHAVELAPKIDAALCPTRDPRCLVDQYRAAGVQVVVLGTLEPRGTLAYQVYDTWTGARAFDGVLRVSGVSTPALGREIGEIVRPIVQRGGLLDERPAAAPPEAPVSVRPTPMPPGERDRAVVIAAGVLIALVASPLLLALLLVGTRELGRRKAPTSWKWSVLLLVALALIPIATSLLDVSALASRLAARAPPVLALLLLPASAGLLWGALTLALGVWLFAPIRGLERIRHDALWPMARAWTTLFVVRAAALALLYAPIVVLALRACAAIALSPRVTLAFVVPAAGLLMHFWCLSMVDNLSVYLDVHLATGAPTPRNPWHATLKRYFVGYLTRNVVEIEIDPKLLEQALLLPGVRDDVVSYGGGFAQPRIVVGLKPLEAALGELPDEEEVPDRAVNAEELPAGLLVPSPGRESDLGLLARAEQWRRRLTRAPVRVRAHMPRLLGENATLLGWVLPQPIDKGIPLISDTEEDFGVVKRLLAEHYSAFEGMLHDDEVDDTDPTQKDFLFGALLREIGVIARHDVYFATFARSLEVLAARAGWLGRVLRLPLSLYERFLSTPGARVADAYAALNNGLHPLVQYLCFVRGEGEARLTARANVPQLVETSRVMVAHVERSDLTPAERDAFRATPRDRVVWLTTIFHGQSLASSRWGRIRWGRVVGFVVVAGAATALVVRLVTEAIAYHPTYVERMKTQAARATERENPR